MKNEETKDPASRKIRFTPNCLIIRRYVSVKNVVIKKVWTLVLRNHPGFFCFSSSPLDLLEIPDSKLSKLIGCLASCVFAFGHHPIILFMVSTLRLIVLPLFPQ